MKTKNLWFLVGALMVLALVLAACGGTQPTTQEPAPTAETVVEEAPPTEAAAPTEGDGITLRWRTRPDNQAEIDVYQSVSDSIDIPGVTLVYEPGGSETASYQDVLKTELAAGTAPDVFWIPGTDVADFVQRGLLYNLRDLADATDGYADSDFYEGPMFHLTFNPETSTNEGVLWGLPRDVSPSPSTSTSTCWPSPARRDPRELAANGEWDWDTFIEVATAIDALGGDIRGYGQNAWWGPYGYWINAAGGGFFNEDRTACALDTPESLAGLDFERASIRSSTWPCPTASIASRPSWPARSACSRTAAGPPPASRHPPTSTGMWSSCPTAPPVRATGSSGALTSSTPTPPIPKKPGSCSGADQRRGPGPPSAELGANIPSRVSQEAIDAFLTFSPPANNQAFINGLAENPATEGPLWAGNWPEFDAIMGPAVQSVLNGETSIDDLPRPSVTKPTRPLLHRR
jgi:multiple sugar transport system substrate-binding protein